MQIFFFMPECNLDPCVWTHTKEVRHKHYPPLLVHGWPLCQPAVNKIPSNTPPTCMHTNNSSNKSACFIQEPSVIGFTN